MPRCCQEIPKKMLKLLNSKDTILKKLQRSRDPEYSKQLYEKLNKTDELIKRYKRC